MQLHEISSNRVSRKKRKIVGRGPGSGHGKTSCRGHKGQRSRSGCKILVGSEGGQMPLIRRLPKVGFRRRNRMIYQLVKLDSLSQFKEGVVVDADFLKSHGLIKSLSKPIKILGNGELKKPFAIHAHKFSKSAEEKIKKIGGKVELIKK